MVSESESRKTLSENGHIVSNQVIRMSAVQLETTKTCFLAKPASASSIYRRTAFAEIICNAQKFKRAPCPPRLWCDHWQFTFWKLIQSRRLFPVYSGRSSPRTYFLEYSRICIMFAERLATFTRYFEPLDVQSEDWNVPATSLRSFLGLG